MTQSVSPAFLKPGPHLELRNFLGPEQNAELLEFVLSKEREFLDSKVVARGGEEVVDRSRRISYAYTPPKEIRTMFRENVRRWLDRIFEDLKVSAFDPSRIEVDMAAHGDGAFFSTHLDSIPNDPDGNTRVLSLVYYFCATPPAFTGGELRLHSLAGKGAPGTYADVVPENDMAAVFPSWIPHEVLPVRLPDNQFRNCRFAVNCWVNKKKA